MTATPKQNAKYCDFCGELKKTQQSGKQQVCATCRTVISNVKNHPEIVKRAWQQYQDEPIIPKIKEAGVDGILDLPEVLDGKRYRAIDRDKNKWYLSVSEVDGDPIEVFASTAFDRDHELQSRISNLTTITRLISFILRHIFLSEQMTFDKCLKQIQRSSRQKNDLPDMLYGVLSKYEKINPKGKDDSPSPKEAA